MFPKTAKNLTKLAGAKPKTTAKKTQSSEFLQLVHNDSASSLSSAPLNFSKSPPSPTSAELGQDMSELVTQLNSVFVSFRDLNQTRLQGLAKISTLQKELKLKSRPPFSLSPKSSVRELSSFKKANERKHKTKCQEYEKLLQTVEELELENQQHKEQAELSNIRLQSQASQIAEKEEQLVRLRAQVDEYQVCTEVNLEFSRNLQDKIASDAHQLREYRERIAELEANVSKMEELENACQDHVTNVRIQAEKIKSLDNSLHKLRHFKRLQKGLVSLKSEWESAALELDYRYEDNEEYSINTVNTDPGYRAKKYCYVSTPEDSINLNLEAPKLGLEVPTDVNVGALAELKNRLTTIQTDIKKEIANIKDQDDKVEALKSLGFQVGDKFGPSMGSPDQLSLVSTEPTDPTADIAVSIPSLDGLVPKKKSRNHTHRKSWWKRAVKKMSHKKAKGETSSCSATKYADGN